MPLANFSLEGKVAIVTGASRGIGRAISIGLAEHGADVVLAARKPEDLEDAAQEVKKTGKKALAIPTNVRRTEELKKLIDETLKGLGRVDILVNNAGTNPVFGPIQEIDERAFDTIMNTNVKAIHFLSAFAREAMLQNESGGSIINVSSIASSLKGLPNRFVYGASKAAIIGLTKSIASDFVKQNIRCNSIAPGTVFSPSWQDRVNQSPDPVQAKKDFIARQPMGRLGTAEEIASMAIYLAGDESTFTTGNTFSVDGGMTI